MTQNQEKIFSNIQNTIVNDKNVHGYYQTYKKYELGYYRPVLKYISELKNINKILDIGGAYGTLLLYSMKIHSQNSGYLIDNSPFMNNEFAQKFGINKKKLDIETDDYLKEKFDLIIFTEIIEHLNFHPIPTLMKIKKMMHKDSVLIISTPDADSGWGRVTKDAYDNFGLPHYQSLNDIPKYENQDYEWKDGHIWQYTKSELDDILKKTGFEIIKFDYSESTNKNYIHLCYMVKIAN